MIERLGKGSKRNLTVNKIVYLGHILCLVLQGLKPVHATVLSTELREFADTQLLFWSSFDCAIDAALNFFGPIDQLLRFPQEYPPSSDPLLAVFDEGPSILREAQVLLDNFVRGWTGETSNKDKYHYHLQAELQVPEPPTCDKHSHTVPNTAAHQVCGDEVPPQNHNHSSLQIRGGGRPGARHKFEFSLFQEGDGSEQDPDGIPKRYLDMHGGNRNKALKSLKHTLEWRKKEGIDTILAKPHPKLAVCKEIFPTSFLGHDPDGHVIFIQRPALMDVDLAKRNKIVKEDLLKHYIYMNEYLWQVLEADKPMGTMISILDLSGLDTRILRNREYLSFLKLFISVMDAHYPQRAHKTLVVNSPKWIGTIYRLVKPFLREETTKRIEIHIRGRKQDHALKSALGTKAASMLPQSFWSGGKKERKKKRKRDEEPADEEPRQFPESDLDAKLLAHVRRGWYCDFCIEKKTECDTNKLTAFAIIVAG